MSLRKLRKPKRHRKIIKATRFTRPLAKVIKVVNHCWVRAVFTGASYNPDRTF